MIVRVYIILCSNFCNNLLMWFFFQLYVDSNSLPKFKDRKSIILQCSSYLKLLFSFSLNSVMASLLQFLLSPSHHCPLLIIKKKTLYCFNLQRKPVILNLHLSRSVFQQWKSEVSFNVSLFEIHREPTVLPHSIICVKQSC